MKRSKAGKEVTASQLAQMGCCERRIMFAARHGARVSPARREAMDRGTAEHAKLYREGIRGGGESDTRAARPWCFVATMLYGAQAAETRTLQALRDQVRRRWRWGRACIGWYYRVSPRLCHRLAGRPLVLGALRVLLRPVVWAAGALVAMCGIGSRR